MSQWIESYRLISATAAFTVGTKARLVRVLSFINFTPNLANQGAVLTVARGAELLHVNQAGNVSAAAEPIFKARVSELGILIASPLEVLWTLTGAPSCGGVLMLVWSN